MIKTLVTVGGIVLITVLIFSSLSLASAVWGN